MSDQSQITIIGLGLIGTSIGLALKKGEQKFIIIGHDRDAAATQRAKQQGAIDKSHWNLIAACENADLVILAIPTAGIPPTLEALKDELKPGSLILDTAPIKTPVLAAAQALPDSVHFVGGNPVLVQTGIRAENASADLFRGASWALCPTPETSPDAVRVAADFVTAIGAQPLFLDAAEHDGLMAAVDGLPSVLAAALTNTAGRSQAWREIRRMAGNQFESNTYLPEFDPQDLTASVMASSTYIAPWIDSVIEELNGWKQALQMEDADAVQGRFSQAIDLRNQWLVIRARGDWEEADRLEDTPSFWRRMIGFGGKKRD